MSVSFSLAYFLTFDSRIFLSDIYSELYCSIENISCKTAFVSNNFRCLWTWYFRFFDNRKPFPYAGSLGFRFMNLYPFSSKSSSWFIFVSWRQTISTFFFFASFLNVCRFDFSVRILTLKVAIIVLAIHIVRCRILSCNGNWKITTLSSGDGGNEDSMPRGC